MRCPLSGSYASGQVAVHHLTIGYIYIRYVVKVTIIWCESQISRGNYIICVGDTRSAVPEAGIRDRDKLLHLKISVGFNYLSLPWIPTSGKTLMREQFTEDAKVNLFVRSINLLKQVAIPTE